MRSTGVTIRASTSAGSAPGHAIITSTIGTRICGSSSRGVARSARAPRPRLAAISSGVSLLSRKAWATRPARPTRTSGCLGHGVPVAQRRGPQRNPLAGLDAGADLDPLLRGRPDRDPAQAGPPVDDHEDTAESAAPEDGSGRDGEPGTGVRRWKQEARKQSGAEARLSRKGCDDLEAVRDRVGG